MNEPAYPSTQSLREARLTPQRETRVMGIVAHPLPQDELVCALWNELKVWERRCYLLEADENFRRPTVRAEEAEAALAILKRANTIIARQAGYDGDDHDGTAYCTECSKNQEDGHVSDCSKYKGDER